MLPLVGIEPGLLINLCNCNLHNIARSDIIGFKAKNPIVSVDPLLFDLACNE